MGVLAWILACVAGIVVPAGQTGEVIGEDYTQPPQPGVHPLLLGFPPPPLKDSADLLFYRNAFQPQTGSGALFGHYRLRASLCHTASHSPPPAPSTHTQLDWVLGASPGQGAV